MKLDALGRRKRAYRLPDGVEPFITSRDVEVFKLLQRYRYLRTRQIWALLPPDIRGRNYKRFRERLGYLFNAFYLARPDAQKRHANYYYADCIHELDERGHRALTARGIQEPFYDLVARGKAGAHKEFPHAMMVVDTLCSIELALRSVADVSLIPWGEVMELFPASTRSAQNPFRFPEVPLSYTFGSRTENRRVSLIPDSVFAIRYPKGCVLYIFEAERGNPVHRTNLDDNSALKKVLAYRELRKQGLLKRHLGISAVVVLFAFPHAERVNTALKMMMEVTADRGSTMFSFHEIPVFGETAEANPPFPDLYNEPWARAGQPPFYMNNP